MSYRILYAKWDEMEKPEKDRVTFVISNVYVPAHILHNKNDIIPLAFFGLCRTKKKQPDNHLNTTSNKELRKNEAVNDDGNNKNVYLFPYVRCAQLLL